MIPQPPEFFDLYSTDHRRREALAAAERRSRPRRNPGPNRLVSPRARRPALASARPSAGGERTGCT